MQPSTGREHENPPSLVMGEAWSFDSALTGFSDYLVSCGLLPRSVRTYRMNLRVFWRWCLVRGTTPATATMDDIRAYFVERQGDGISSSRRSNDKYALDHYYAWLIESMRRSDTPMPPSLKVKIEKVEPTQPLTAEELERFVTVCDRPRDRLMVLILVTTGMRISELVAMTADDVNWELGHILIHGKGAKERWALLPDYVLEDLRLYVGLIDHAGNAVRSGLLWRSVSTGRPMSDQTVRDKVLKPLSEKAGIEHFHPHRLRATFATMFQNQYGDIETLQALMGHESPATTTRYSGSAKRARSLQQAASLEISERLSRIGRPAPQPRRPGLWERLIGRAAAV